MKKTMVKKLMNKSSSPMRKTNKKMMRELKRVLHKYQTMKKRLWRPLKLKLMLPSWLT